MEVNRGSRRYVVPLTHRLRNLFKQTCLIIAAKATYLQPQLCVFFVIFLLFTPNITHFFSFT
jgi:hypothetical protein